jgi:hypothetical protein
VPHESKVPFVVRKGGDRRCYKVIGECYIEGIMYHNGHVPEEVVLEDLFKWTIPLNGTRSTSVFSPSL